MPALLSLVIFSVTFIFTFPFSYADKLKMPSSIFSLYLYLFPWNYTFHVAQKYAYLETSLLGFCFFFSCRYQ